MIAIVARIFLAVTGCVAAWLWCRWRWQQDFARRNVKAADVQKAAQREASRIRREGAERAAASHQEHERAFAEQEQSETADLAEYEAVLVDRESLLDSRERAVIEHEQQIEAAERSTQKQAQIAASAQNEATALQEQRLVDLEKQCGIAIADARKQRAEELVSKAELAVLIRLRETETKLNETAAGESRRIMRMAMERYDGESHLERVQSSMTLEPRVFAALVDIKGPCRTVFAEEVPCELVLDEELLLATVRGDDPLAREVARRVLRQLSGQREITPAQVRTWARQTSMEVERDVQSAGRKAFRTLGLGRAHADVLHLVGRLKFRLSYSQNQWRHAIEVGQLAGLMAAELQLDVMTARRGGLLHDIGKAMTHDHEGSHATLGADVARRSGEDEVVVNAIASHHNDEPARTPIAFIVAAADALSGGRPGARRESVTQYLNRIQDIQRIASRSPAVKRVDIMQAGREVRVVVAGAERGAIDPSELHRGPHLVDADLQPLAQKIARTIESELTFAGQIKVTVIRESRAVSVAY